MRPDTSPAASPGALPRVRDAERGDVARIVELLRDDEIGAVRDAGPPGEPAPSLAPYLAAFDAVAADPAHRLVVLEVAGPGAAVEVVGTLQLTALPGLSRRGATRAQVEAVRIASTHRSGGLGAVLLGWAVDEARRLGCDVVQLTTDARRTDAQRFYRRLGFEATHVGMKLTL